MGLGIGRLLRKVSFEVVPGARYSLLDVVLARRHLLGDTSMLLFDSFEGLPASDQPEDAAWRPGELAEGFELVRHRFAQYPNVQLVKGWFKDTLPSHGALRIKVRARGFRSVHVHHRGDAWLLDRIVPGGAIVYDDYGFANCPGSMKAVDETLGKRADFFKLYLPTGQYVALKRAWARLRARFRFLSFTGFAGPYPGVVLPILSRFHAGGEPFGVHPA